MPIGFFPFATRSSGRLDAVIERVADDVHQRIGQLLDHHLVELRVFAAQHQLDLFVQLARDFAHGARELRVDLPDRHHARLDDRFLQLVELAVEVARDLGQLVRGEPRLLQRLALMQRARERIELRLLDDQLADDVHDVIELADVDAHGLRDRAQRQVFLRRSASTLAGRFRLFAATSTFPSGTSALTASRVERRSVQQPEGDARAAAAVDRRQRGDHLARRAQHLGQRAQLFVEVAEVEAHFDGEDLLPRPHVFQQAMLFVFGQRLLASARRASARRTDPRAPAPADS